MKQWSALFQNEEYLEMTRMYTLNKDMLGMVISNTGIKPGMKVLDVASGSGEYIYYLSQGVQNTSFTGIDLDEQFIESADRIKNKRLANNNQAEFVQGDAADMPFASCSFDAVVSHTFFNSIPRYMDALYEMKRVAKYGSRISTIATMETGWATKCPGVYPPDAIWKNRYDELYEKVHIMIETTAPFHSYLKGISTKYIPYIFSQAGLKDISVYPIGNFISLSNAAMPAADKERYIQLDYTAEMKRTDAVYEAADPKKRISPDELNEYRALCRERKDYLLAHIGENSIWEWTGFADILIVGSKPTEDETIMSLFV